MWQWLLTICIVAFFSILGFFLSFQYLTTPVAILSCLFILAISAIIFYFSRQPEKESKSLGTKAITTIAALTGTNPLWAKMLAAKGPAISTSFPDIFRNVETGFVLTTSLGVLAIVAIVWLDTRDKTIGGAKPGNLADEVGEIGFKDKLIRMAQVLETRLTSLDDETNWTDQAFTPLDAEIEKASITGGRPRKIVDLITGIRRDHSSTGFLVLGDPGSGKSVAMRRLTREMLKEVATTQVLPIYVNLKEWADSHNVAEGRPVDAFKFISEYLKSTGNDLIIEFCDTYLRRLLEVGRLFIIFDSFDEIPVLLDQDESSDVIATVSKNLEEFMIGPHNSRCVIASRYFRRPRFLSTRVSMLEILPMSDRKIRETLVKSQRLSPDEIDNFFRSRNQWISYAKNPFVANLVVNFISTNEGRLPRSKIEVYESYIDKRLSRLSSILEKYQYTIPAVSSIATRISYEMFSRDAIGLEADLSDMLLWMIQKYKLNSTRQAIDIMVKGRLMRCSPYPDERVSFVHRRFNEYFLALATQEGLMRVEMESIATDRRDRDAIVLYVELASDDEALEILTFCWLQIAGAGTSSPDLAPEPNREAHALNLRTRATYCLRFLVDAFTSSKRHVVNAVSAPLLEYLSSAVRKHATDMLGAKIAVEATGLLGDEQASEVIGYALRTGNYWIVETAIRAARNVQNISTELRSLIVRYILGMSETDVLKKRRDFVDLFKLNPSLGVVPSILNMRFLAIVVQWPIRIAIICLLPLLYAATVSLVVYILFFSWLPGLSFFGRTLSDRTTLMAQLSKGAWNYFIQVQRIFVLAFWLAIIGLILRGFGLDLISEQPHIIQLGSYSSTGIVLLLLIIGAVGINDIVPICRLGYQMTTRSMWQRALTRASRFAGFVWNYINSIKRAAIALCVVSTLVLGLAGYIYLLDFLAQFNVFSYGVTALIFGSLLYLLFSNLHSFAVEWRRIRRLPPGRFDTRTAIDGLFKSVKSEYLRNRLVVRIEEFHRKNGSRPTGSWPHGAAPNRGDRASIRLSQLDEIWTGLER